MDEKFQKFKKVVSTVFKHLSRPFIIVALIICIVIIFIASALYFITIDDGSYKDGDKANVPYAVEGHTTGVIIDGNGNISTSQTAKELWDEMIKNGSRVDEYLDGPDELQKLINAEMVTEYLDTRPNPEAPIDWKKLNKDVNSKAVQGIIKLKRADSDGNTSTITYIDPETFQTYIDNYNESGSEEDKQKALSHFTLEKGYASSSFGTGATITAGTTINIPAGLGAIHTYMGWQMITSTTSTQYKLREQAGMNFDGEGFGRINGRYVIACTTTFGNVGDYIDFYQEDGSIIQCIIGDIKNQNDAGCNEWGHLNGTCIIEFVVDKDTWYNSNHPNPGQEGFHMEWNQNLVKAINGGSYFDNPSFGSDTITGNGNMQNQNSIDGNNSIGNGLMKWPTDGTNITSYFGLRDAPTAGASTSHGGIDIGVPMGTNVYATEDGTVTTAGWSDSAGNLVVIDHGNGYVTKYMHNSALKVSAGEKVTKGQVIALAGSTGISTGPHVHFQVEYNGVRVDPLTFKYDNGMGDGMGGIGSNSGSLSTNNTFYAKVATWNEITDIVKSDDPSVEEYTTKRYNMSSTKINYQELVSGYKMPFDYLWAFLVVGQEKNFVFDLADLVYDSEIEITIHDNLTTNTNISTDTYTNTTKVITDDVKVKVTYGNVSPESPTATPTLQTTTVTGGPFEKEKEEDYTTVHTVITKTNTLDVSLTKANVWIVDYSQEYTYQIPDPIVTPPSQRKHEEEYPEEPNKTDGIDSLGLAESYRQSVQATYAASYTTVSTRVTSLTSKYYYKTNGIVNIENTSESKKYVASPAKIREKTEKWTDEDNFVTIFLKSKNYKAGTNILNAADWLFEILESGKNTVNMLDLTKYLLYKATNEDYGVKNFDFSIYNPKNFKSLGDQYGGQSNIDGIPGQIYDFLLAKGIPPVGAAAILGNIEGESSFVPSASNGTHNGLCQWSIKDRFKALETLANSKGTSWTDVNTQLEFMWSELEGSYQNVKNVIMSATQESDMEYATWYWGRYYEIYFLGNNFESTKDYSKKRYEYAQKWYKQWKEKHTGSSGNVQVGEAARIQGTEERIRWLYDGNELPTTKAENDKYLETFQVEYLDANSNRQTMNVTMHRKLKTEVQAIFKEMADAGFKIVGGDISYRQWGSDAGFQGRFPQSAHTYGHAFDVNPEQNYCIYANGTVVGDHYTPGSDPYSVTEPIINIWKQHGFYWGGDWTSLKDYMHFSYFNH